MRVAAATRARPARLIITPGEPAGIGPDIVLALAQRHQPAEIVVCADPALLERRIALHGADIDLIEYRPADRCSTRAGSLVVLPQALEAEAQPGKLDPRNARYVLACLDRAVDGCLRGEFDAMVTGPVQKSVINQAGIPFTGHTEYLAARCGSPRVVMLLTDGSLRVALVTTHLPLAQVPGAISAELIEAVVRIVHAALRDSYGIRRPHLLVCGLNPHAGESGQLGTEEQTVIEPALARLREAGLRLTGPLAADTAFTARQLDGVDAVITMYHDQGLPVLKARGFGHAVNVTLGLPIVRTSVDHGTALALAGTTHADPGSLFAAVQEAIRLSQTRRGA